MTAWHPGGKTVSALESLPLLLQPYDCPDLAAGNSECEKISRTMWKRLIWLSGILLGVVLCLWLRLFISGLDVSAPHTTLHMGETVQLVVTRKTWLGTEPLAHPERTKYITTWETMTPVDSDGEVTAVGTWGEARESSIVMASNGELHGSVFLSVLADGPGP